MLFNNVVESYNVNTAIDKVIPVEEFSRTQSQSGSKCSSRKHLLEIAS